MDGFAISSPLWDRAFSASSADSDAVDHVALFCFVAKTTGFVGTGWACCTVDNIKLTIFPASNTEEETKDVRLFVLVQF